MTGVSGAAAFPAGSQSNPSISFVGDSDTGIFKFGEGQMNFVSDGTSVFSTSAGGVNVVGAYMGGTGQIAMAGAIWMYQGPSAPTGWAWLNGQTVSSASNPGLTAIYGQSGGNVTLPDWRDFVPIGKGNMGGTSDRGVVTLSGIDTMNAGIGEAAHALSIGELAAHTHTDNGHGHSASDSGHTHGFTTGSGNTTFWTTGGGGNTTLGGGSTSQENDGLSISTGFANITVATGFASLANTGSGTGHNNVQPSVVTGFIIKLG